MARTEELNQFLSAVTEPEIKDILDKIHSGSGYYRLPDDVDLSPEQAARVVAICANKYSEAVRIASIVRARYKIAEANYKYKFRTNLGSGKNAAERESKAMDAAHAEYEEMIYLSALVELVESLESSTRIASESARRMMLGSQQQNFAERRYDHGSDALDGRDFSTH